MAGFVGRTRELDALIDLVGRYEGPSAALVYGEPGSGKSRLLGEVRRQLAVEASFSIVGFEPERQVPLAAASGLLRELARVPAGGAELASLFRRRLGDRSNRSDLRKPSCPRRPATRPA